MKSLLMILVLALSLSPRESQAAQDFVMVGADQAYYEIRETFGFVPTFLKQFPAEAISGAWQEMRDLELSPTTSLNQKTKELIGLAVASQIPCQYCVYFHKRAAKFSGATEKEMNYAIAVAASTRKWSTYFYGAQISMESFKSDIGKMIHFMKNKSVSGIPESSGIVAYDAPEAMTDMRKAFGFTPDFIKFYSSRGLAGAWNEMKTLEMNTQAPLQNKVLDLISLAVSSQIPCQYCIYSDTEFAKFDGANKDEIQESVAMAGIVRHWSTFLNGMQQPQKAFEKEVDQIFKNLEMKRDSLNNKRITYR
ncbi:carboxymuconolactone decarboxylase family protein [Bdellovibrio svalbardensis]|uniref:Carboxymuconolactone decarboxylase family protein n=1 Tax=Bdellovibrio svalbardensis TaxID=2972972 RepID=A0ABT6DJ46_9BACT|nr:carboxymuconolactone decarboxylase family protein [Bdellovibrio svalbardensis]MDG0815103.1 carboxymuconolactone decarboxylase family protein [Bdellovibrio svalbardensis]